MRTVVYTYHSRRHKLSLLQGMTPVAVQKHIVGASSTPDDQTHTLWRKLLHSYEPLWIKHQTHVSYKSAPKPFRVFISSAVIPETFPPTWAPIPTPNPKPRLMLRYCPKAPCPVTTWATEPRPKTWRQGELMRTVSLHSRLWMQATKQYVLVSVRKVLFLVENSLNFYWTQWNLFQEREKKKLKQKSFLHSGNSLLVLSGNRKSVIPSQKVKSTYSDSMFSRHCF